MYHQFLFILVSKWDFSFDLLPIIAYNLQKTIKYIYKIIVVNRYSIRKLNTATRIQNVPAL